jgi:flagellar biosynthesis chaperone FliJ
MSALSDEDLSRARDMAQWKMSKGMVAQQYATDFVLQLLEEVIRLRADLVQAHAESVDLLHQVLDAEGNEEEALDWMTTILTDADAAGCKSESMRDARAWLSDRYAQNEEGEEKPE